MSLEESISFPTRQASIRWESQHQNASLMEMPENRERKAREVLIRFDE